MIMAELGEVEMVWRVSSETKKKKKRMQAGRLEKGDVQSVIELLLRLISHIHFIIRSPTRASLCCGAFVAIRVCAHSVHFLSVSLCVFPGFTCACSMCASYLGTHVFVSLISPWLPSE